MSRKNRWGAGLRVGRMDQRSAKLNVLKQMESFAARATESYRLGRDDDAEWQTKLVIRFASESLPEAKRGEFAAGLMASMQEYDDDEDVPLDLVVRHNRGHLDCCPCKPVRPRRRRAPRSDGGAPDDSATDA